MVCFIKVMMRNRGIKMFNELKTQKNKNVIIENVTDQLSSLSYYSEIANKLDDDDKQHLIDMIGLEYDFVENSGYFTIWEELAKKYAKKEYTGGQPFDKFLNEFVLYYFVDREIPVYRVMLNIDPTYNDFFHGYENANESVREMVDNGDATIYHNYLYFTDYDFERGE